MDWGGGRLGHHFRAPLASLLVDVVNRGEDRVTALLLRTFQLKALQTRTRGRHLQPFHHAAEERWHFYPAPLALLAGAERETRNK